MRKKAANFELEVENCWHRSRDTARTARRKDWRAGVRGGRWARGEGGLRANVPIDCAAKIRKGSQPLFSLIVVPTISTIIFYEASKIQTPIRKF
jgi:hypothetical protein